MSDGCVGEEEVDDGPYDDADAGAGDGESEPVGEVACDVPVERFGEGGVLFGAECVDLEGEESCGCACDGCACDEPAVFGDGHPGRCFLHIDGPCPS